MNSENLQLKEERDRHVRELSDMSEVGKRRDQELIRIEEELKTTNEELQKANAAKVINPIYTLIVPEYFFFSYCFSTKSNTYISYKLGI